MANIQTQKDIIEALKPLIDTLVDERVKNAKKSRPMQVFEYIMQMNNKPSIIKLVDIGDYDFDKNIWINQNAIILTIENNSRKTYSKGDFVNIQWAYSLNSAKIDETNDINLNQSFFFEIVNGELMFNFFEWEKVPFRPSINSKGELIIEYDDTLGEIKLAKNDKGMLIYTY